jgi:hypothetical protein
VHAWRAQVRFLEAVDVMVGQIIARLAAAEEADGGGGGGDGDGDAFLREGGQAGLGRRRRRRRFSICVTGDHSTPVIFGDHSHEPVPFALARASDAADALGGPGQLALRRPGGKISLPDVKAPPPALDELVAQAAAQERRRAAAARGEQFPLPPGVGEDSDGGGGGGGTAAAGFGGWAEAWPQAVLWDGVAAFDEISAARGALGRFPGSEVMPLLKRFAAAEV